MSTGWVSSLLRSSCTTWQMSKYNLGHTCHMLTWRNWCNWYRVSFRIIWIQLCKHYKHRDYIVYGLSQWVFMFQCNVISQSVNPWTEWSVTQHHPSWFFNFNPSQILAKNNKIITHFTHCGLATPLGDNGLSQHWLRKWLLAWRHQVITWTNVHLSSVRSFGHYRRELS